MKKLTPTWNNVLIRKLDAEEMTPGGIILPETATTQAFPQTAIVVKVGPGNVTESGEVIPMEVSEGDEVLIPKYSGSKVEVNGENLTLIPENEIILRIERS